MDQSEAIAITETPVGADRKAALAEALRQRILTMELAPGAVLDEVALSTEFGLSRPPVREIMRQMAGEGFIKLELNRAARVTGLSYESLRGFFLVAPMVYVSTTKLAAEHATKADIERLRAIQGRFRRALDEDDVYERVFANDEFHLAVGEVARNEYLLPSLRRLLIDHSRIARIYYRANGSADEQNGLRVAADQHDEIIDAIELRDPETGGRVVKAHLELSRRNMAAYAMPQGIDPPTDT